VGNGNGDSLVLVEELPSLEFGWNEKEKICFQKEHAMKMVSLTRVPSFQIRETPVLSQVF
jgi:hypothetical protein